MSNTSPRRQRLVDRVFVIGVTLKGLDGLAELLFGIPLLFLRPAQINALAQSATSEELREDPHDLISNLLLHGAAHLSGSAALLGAIYLIFHGAVKLAIIVALLRGTRRVYPWAIAALGAFLVLQVVQFSIHPSVGVALLSVMDAVIIVLTWREWREGRTLPDAWRNAIGGRTATQR
ncbi:DUF2127 domain-containing protein [Curtobacterium sp. ISL-83]|uniref:DUF2127 domain-containing protein n=1 Tax=Curtobacterium sp. ISL-83 TaxID=2819145 RepID=UPI001BE59AF4|nr:DUF2127 domain-containing protein [Curtobacterium sp. ISL-83]MBT2504159.1 DUF2127 domain-containing protein [Curtobacterium sp. ISL-83]